MTSATACAIRVESREQPGRQHRPVQLELEVGDHRDQVGVAGALAVAVDAALHVRRAGVDRGQRVRDRAAAVVVGVDADPDAGRSRRRRAPRRRPSPGSMPPLVSQSAIDVGAGLVRRAQHLERVVAVGAVAVEEVLGVEEHLLPLGLQVADGVAHHREVLLERGAQGQLDVPVVRLRDQRDHRGAAVAQRGDQRVVGGDDPGPAGGAERRELGVPAGRARPPPGGRTRCPWGSRPASRPRCSPRPSPSSCRAIVSLSATERLSPSCWAPSRSVVS